jgi:hypothetical protein
MLLVAIPSALAALTCQDLLAMASSHLPEEVIVQSLGDSGFSPDDPSCLQGGALSEPIVAAARANARGPLPDTSAPDGPPPPPTPAVLDPVVQAEALRRQAEAEAADRASTVDALISLAMSAYHLGDTPTAKAKLAEAAALDPKNPLIAAANAFLASPVKGLHAGGWSLTAKTDEMTGHRRLYAQISASNMVRGVLGQPVRPILFARCDDSLEMFVAAGGVLNSDYGEIYSTSGRVRFDGEEATGVGFTLGDDHDAAFFLSPESYIDKMVGATEARVELPYYSTGDQVIRFTMTGARTVLPLVRAACSGA